MRVFIAGIDGYLGWPLAVYLSAVGHEVAGADLMLRRQWVAEVGGVSAQPIASREARLWAHEERFGKAIDFRVGDLMDYGFVKDFFRISNRRRWSTWGNAVRPLFDDGSSSLCLDAAEQRHQ